MSVTVRVPPVFRPLTSGQSTVSVEGGTVAQVLASLDAAYPGFSSKLLSDDGSLVRYVNLFVDDDDVRFMKMPCGIGKRQGKTGKTGCQ